MCCWRGMEKISWTDHVRSEEVLLIVKEQRNILHEICKRKANWIGHILRRNCLLQRVIERKIQEKIEATGRQGRRRTKLLDDLKERRRYSHLKEEALNRTMWRARFGRGFGPVVRQTTKWMNEWMSTKKQTGKDYDTAYSVIDKKNCYNLWLFTQPALHPVCILLPISITVCTAGKVTIRIHVRHCLENKEVTDMNIPTLP